MKFHRFACVCISPCALCMHLITVHNSFRIQSNCILWTVICCFDHSNSKYSSAVNCSTLNAERKLGRKKEEERCWTCYMLHAPFVGTLAFAVVFIRVRNFWMSWSKSTLMHSVREAWNLIFIDPTTGQRKNKTIFVSFLSASRILQTEEFKEFYSAFVHYIFFVRI